MAKIKDILPHQLAISPNQLARLLKGEGVNIPHKNMGAHKGEQIVHLLKPNAKKLLGAYKKGKGVRIQLSPDEIKATFGSGFFDDIKDAGKKVLSSKIGKQIAKKGVHYGATALGAAVGTAVGNPLAGALLGEAIGQSAEIAIDSIKVKNPKKRAEIALETAIEKLPVQEQKIISNSVPNQIFSGYGMMEKKVKLRKHKIGGDLLDEKISARQAIGKAGDFVKNPRSVLGLGMSGGDLLDEKFSARQAIQKAGDFVKNPRSVLGVGMSGGSLLDEQFSARQAIGKAGDFVKSPRSVLGLGAKPMKGSPEMAEKMAKLRAMRKMKKGGDLNSDIVEGLKKVGHYSVPALARAVGGPLAGVLAEEGDHKLGFGMKKRGRPKKQGMGLATQSKAFKKALEVNFGGLELNDTYEDNKPVEDFETNPVVKPSSDLMTLSPYARMDSPAMNPFIPMTYRQAGGQTCGYGGRGLYL